MKKFGALLLACVLSFSLVGCGNNDGGSDAAASGSGDVSGTVALNGSTSMEKLVNGLKEGIVETYPNLQLEPQFTGSSAGVEAVTNGTADIGDVSRALTDEEKAAGLVENIVALDGIAVVTDTANTATNLTTQQLKDIYTGKITNWSEVGGADQNIVVIGRESGSGTRDAFEEILDIADQCQLAQTLNETGAVAAAVQSTPGAIGYISLDALNDKVKALQLDGVAPSEETVKDGSYTLQRPFVMATKGEISEQSAQVQAVFEFINSDAGQEVISSVGLVSAK
ncbi:phosphate ABC transporter substrate-binding protein [Massilimicrobiota sp. An142]|jgi:phosphate binding protein|uniref:Phosphate-binding protein n=1 Tax=Massilimicrobiota timonensis TaxID=1776392 RepID=A0ABT7UL05_9FIRM|nr:MULTISPECIES: phosphate ABC transporter substrate-binding protein [Massilimicrobiota]MDM8196822.1 phosphate ABC transporter substrate-binding protein [Massilimicrobiota timonensis]OUQ09433.1 phosphate ABC transporter substrate-binding protein [Massilimicrobiota sp. An142]